MSDYKESMSQHYPGLGDERWLPTSDNLTFGSVIFRADFRKISNCVDNQVVAAELGFLHHVNSGSYFIELSWKYCREYRWFSLDLPINAKSFKDVFSQVELLLKIDYDDIRTKIEQAIVKAEDEVEKARLNKF